MDLQIFFDFHTALIVGAIYIIINWVKALIGAYAPSWRNDSRFKKIILPLCNLMLGMVLALFLSPDALDTIAEQLSYGAIIGTFWAGFYRSFKAALPFEQAIEKKLSNSIRPLDGGS